MIRSSFSIPGDPIGKPTWQKSDKWLSGDEQRPVVARYRAWCSTARLEATGNPDQKISADLVYHIYIFAHIPMPESWSKKKKAALEGTIHRSKPDSDNITKAVKDALFGEDKYISGDTSEKFWCHQDEQPRVDIFLLISPSEIPHEEITPEVDCVSEKPGDGVA